jgi:hypothetical protein
MMDSVITHAIITIHFINTKMVNQYGYNVQNAPPSVIHHHNYYGSNTPQRTDARGNSDPSPKVYSSNQKM